MSEDLYIVNLSSGKIHCQDDRRDKEFEFDLEPFGDENGEDRRLIDHPRIPKLPGIKNAEKKGLIALVTEEELAKIDETCATRKVVMDVDRPAKKALRNYECVGLNVLNRQCKKLVVMTEEQLEDRPPLCASCKDQREEFYVDPATGNWRHQNGDPVKVEIIPPTIDVALLPTGDEDYWNPKDD